MHRHNMSGTEGATVASIFVQRQVGLVVTMSNYASLS